MIDVIICMLLQIVFTIGIILIFGTLISLCNKAFYSQLGKRAKLVCYATGFLGTPVHELSHALFCIIFGHKIVDVKLFSLDPDDGNLGYVKHSYNKKNIYQTAGNFFIGIAPIIGITAVMYLLSMWLMPAFTEKITNVAISGEYSDVASLWEIFKDIMLTFVSQFTTYQWWIFLLISIPLALHMTLSKADIKGATTGIIATLIALAIVNFSIADEDMALLFTLTRWIIGLGCAMLCFFLVALAVAVGSILISFIIRLFVGKKA